MLCQKTLEANGNNMHAELVRAVIDKIREFWSFTVTRRNFSQISRSEWSEMVSGDLKSLMSILEE